VFDFFFFIFFKEKIKEQGRLNLNLKRIIKCLLRVIKGSYYSG